MTPGDTVTRPGGVIWIPIPGMFKDTYSRYVKYNTRLILDTLLNNLYLSYMTIYYTRFGDWNDNVK